MALRDFQTRIGSDQSGVQAFSIPAGEVALVCRAKPVRDRINEDAVGIFPLGGDLAVLVVADGMGGGAQGETAARLVIESLQEQLTPLAEESELRPVRAAILYAIEVANRRVLDLGVGAGATVAAALVSPKTYATVHAGDSIVLVVGQRGRIKAQTLAHSPVGFAQEAGILNEGQAMFHKERHLVSNVVGMENMRLEVAAYRDFDPKDTLIMASDGLFDNLTIPEIVERTRCGPLEAAAKRVAELSQQRMSDPNRGEPSKPDDLGLVLFRPHRSQ